MPNEATFAKLMEALQSANSALKVAQTHAGKLGKDLGYSADKIDELVKSYAKRTVDENENVQIIEGIFDGQNMKGPDNETYPVPANYASKSKLVQGDKLKLTIAENGAFIYKQIEPIARKLVIGNLVLDGSQYQVVLEKKSYNVLFASVTFFKAKVGDKVTIIIPADDTSLWAAIENVIPEETQEEKSS